MEPLAFGLLDPRVHCKNLIDDAFRKKRIAERHEIMQISKDFILLPPDRCAVDSGGKFMYFDLGASWYSGIPPNANLSTYIDGWGSSGKWFVDEFEKRGVEFDFLFLWEPRPFEEYRRSGFPRKYEDRVKYFQGRIEVEGHNSPLEVVRQNCRQQDYCLVKVDYDTPSSEIALVKRLMKDSHLLSLIDEFFWDPVGLPIEIHRRTISDMRRLGIHAHSWP